MGADKDSSDYRCRGLAPDLVYDLAQWALRLEQEITQAQTHEQLYFVLQLRRLHCDVATPLFVAYAEAFRYALLVIQQCSRLRITK